VVSEAEQESGAARPHWMAVADWECCWRPGAGLREGVFLHPCQELLAAAAIRLLNHLAAAPTPLMPCSYRVPRLELLSCSTNGTLVAAGGGDKVLFWDRRTQVCACGCRVARLLVGWNDACIAQLPGLPPPAHWPQTSPASLPLDETHRDCTH